MIVLDTSALVGFFTKDDNEKALKVRKLLFSHQILVIPDVVFAEIEYILLKGTYNVERSNLLHMFQLLVTAKNVRTSSVVKIAVRFYEQSHLDMADCIIAATSVKGELASFDKKMLRLPGVNSFWQNS